MRNRESEERVYKDPIAELQQFAVTAGAGYEGKWFVLPPFSHSYCDALSLTNALFH